MMTASSIKARSCSAWTSRGIMVLSIAAFCACSTQLRSRERAEVVVRPKAVQSSSRLFPSLPHRSQPYSEAETSRNVVPTLAATRAPSETALRFRRRTRFASLSVLGCLCPSRSSVRRPRKIRSDERDQELWTAAAVDPSASPAAWRVDAIRLGGRVPPTEEETRRLA